MKNMNQDAMLPAQPQSSGPGTGSPLQIPDQANGPGDDDNDDPAGTPDRPETADTGAPSGSPNMEPDRGNETGTDEAIGNNDGTETSPEATDSDEFLK